MSQWGRKMAIGMRQTQKLGARLRRTPKLISHVINPHGCFPSYTFTSSGFGLETNHPLFGLNLFTKQLMGAQDSPTTLSV